MSVKGKTVIISSQVAYGYVGGNMTSLVLKLNGQETLAVPTTVLSNHLGFDTVGGGPISIRTFEGILEGIVRLDVFQHVETIITGFFDSEEQVVLTAAWINNLKKKNPTVQYVCDPVMGDFKDGGLFVSECVADAITSLLVPLADLLTPNHFEFERIVGRRLYSRGEMQTAFCDDARLKGKKMVVTGCHLGHEYVQTVNNVILDTSGYGYVSNLKVNLDPVGAGDLFTALVCIQLKLQMDFTNAIKNSATMMVTLINDMLREGRKEFELIDLLKIPMLINNVAAIHKVLMN